MAVRPVRAQVIVVLMIRAVSSAMCKPKTPRSRYCKGLAAMAAVPKRQQALVHNVYRIGKAV